MLGPKRSGFFERLGDTGGRTCRDEGLGGDFTVRGNCEKAGCVVDGAVPTSS